MTNLKLCNSFVEVLPFSLEWNNCDTKFYKDAKLTELHKKRKNNNRSKKEIRKTAEIKSKTEIDSNHKTVNPATQLKLGHNSFFFSFRLGALINKSDFFASKMMVQKRYSYIIRGIVIHM